jgi:hypothetical protein
LKDRNAFPVRLGAFLISSCRSDDDIEKCAIRPWVYVWFHPWIDELKITHLAGRDGFAGWATGVEGATPSHPCRGH